tara:strand:+ start:1817 stop:3124 length:1308 start_codon:yes stop_codon:yes gene_type:complete
MTKTIALVGRTNVGKSSIFNKLVKAKSSIVSSEEGLTRDMKTAEIKSKDKTIQLIDTGGFYTSKDDDLEDLILIKAHEAIAIADLILLIVDNKFGLSPFDKQLANILRKSGKEVVLVVNKIDVKTDEGTQIFHELGFKTKIEISAEHNLNIDDLKELIFKNAPKNEDPPQNVIPKISVIGKPNVGKSSTVNALLDQDQMIVSDIAGTTIDSVDVKINYRSKDYYLVDTAGIRRKNKTTEKEEKFSVIKALDSIEKSDLTILMLDATNFLAEQDMKLIEKAKEIGRSMVIVVNKIDLIAEKEIKRIKERIKEESSLKGFPLAMISALERKGFRTLFDYVYRVLENSKMKLSTNKLNKILLDAKESKSIPYKGKFKPKIRYVHQGGRNPHVLTFHGNSLDKLEGSYVRFLGNYFHKKLNLMGTNIKLKFINSKNPYK